MTPFAQAEAALAARRTSIEERTKAGLRVEPEERTNLAFDEVTDKGNILRIPGGLAIRGQFEGWIEQDPQTGQTFIHI